MPPSIPFAQTLIGRQLGNYRLDSVLGEGGMGVVFLATHQTLGRRAAIKLLRPELCKNDELVERFINEARAANRVAHPGIIDVYEVDQNPELGAYLIMEYLQGESLAQLVERSGRLPLPLTALILRRIVGPLEAAHGAGIVHRDLKPDNIFILGDPDHPGDLRVKLLDFGVAKLIEVSPTLRTGTGVLLGTPFFMSPEQAHGAREVDARADIYALGVIVYQLLSGQLPFQATGFGELLLKHQMETPPPFSHWQVSISANVEAVILRALAKQPDDRYGSAGELAEALTQAAKAEQSGLNELALTQAKTLVASNPALSGLQAAPQEKLSTLPEVVSAPPLPKDPRTPLPKTQALSTHSTAQRTSLGPLVWLFIALSLGGGATLAALLLSRGSRSLPSAETAARDKGVRRAVGQEGSATQEKLPGPPKGKFPRDPVSMVRIPAGPYKRGSARAIDIGRFLLDRYEVTVAQYRRCVEKGRCSALRLSGTELPGQVDFSRSTRCNWERRGAANHPINCITWSQAADYCRWAGKRLPTEDEWAKAAAGPDGRIMPWGDVKPSCDRAVIKTHQPGCGTGHTFAVGSRSPDGDSLYGAADMVGNVAEWTATAIRKQRRVWGGSFTNPAGEISISRGISLPTGYRLEDLGFRCAAP